MVPHINMRNSLNSYSRRKDSWKILFQALLEVTCLFYSVYWPELVTYGRLVAGKEWEELWMSSGKPGS